MKATAVPMTLELKHPFKIARGEVWTSETCVRMSIAHEGVTGFGEARPSEYYFGETIESVLEVVQRAEGLLGKDPFLLEDVIDALRSSFPDAPSAVAGLDIALHDLAGKLLGVPLYRFFGLNPLGTPRTSYTLGIDTLDVMLEKLEEAREYPILKVKVGFDGDLEMLRAIRDHTDAVIRVDANTGWGVDEAIERINEMAQCRIELVEQPIRPRNYDGLRKIRENIDVPLVADEDAMTSADLPALAGCVDAVNIKLMKCGGLREALRMIHVAGALGMKAMLGCMVESSLALTAAAHLSPLTEYADLDMNLLLTNDPFDGLKVRHGKIVLPDRPGVGALAR